MHRSEGRSPSLHPISEGSWTVHRSRKRQTGLLKHQPLALAYQGQHVGLVFDRLEDLLLATTISRKLELVQERYTWRPLYSHDHLLFAQCS
jgi:hypothetical protein